MEQHIQVPRMHLKEEGLITIDPYVYACIKKFMNSETKEAFPSNKTLVEVTGLASKTIIASTASPYKFSEAVLEAVQGCKSDLDEYDMIDKLAELSKLTVPAALADLKNKHERFSDTIDKTEQKDYVLKSLGI